MKLGKKAAKFDPRTPQFRNYIKRMALPPLYPNQMWGQKIGKNSWGMMKNDTVGDCTIATVGHMVMQWTSDALGTPNIISDNDIIAIYTAVTAEENNGHGYNPITGNNDNGCSIIDVLNYWKAIGIGSNKCGGFVQLETGNLQHVQESIHLFGSAYLGVNLPLTAQDQVNTNQGWSVPHSGPSGSGAPGTWGGHAIPIVGYDKDGFTCVTWGALQHMTYNFFKAYCDEVYTILDQDWFNGNKPAPSGFNMAQLQQDMDLLGTVPSGVSGVEVEIPINPHQLLEWFHRITR